MAFSLLTATANWPIIGQISWLLGKVMNFIYTILDSVLPGDNGLVGLSIIFYTIFVYTLMLPMTINQQRSTKMMSVINPEVQAIQKKYRNKKDQASMMKQQEENSGDYGIAPALVIITAVLLPVLSGLTQYLSVKISQAISGQQMDKDNPMASTMNTMNVTMPLFSVFMVFSLPTGIGLYWVISAVVRIIQQVIINKSLRKISIEDLIERNKEKAEKKRQKRGEKAERINAMAQANTRSIRDTAKSSTSGMGEKEKEKKIEQARKSAENAKPGSLASKANMVKKFNENN